MQTLSFDRLKFGIKKTCHAPFGYVTRMDQIEIICLSKLVGNAKASARKFPRDVGGRAHHAAGTAFYAALECDLHGSAVLRAVGTYWAELNAGLVLAIDTNLRINDL
jgi:hypothetical protein